MNLSRFSRPALAAGFCLLPLFLISCATNQDGIPKKTHQFLEDHDWDFASLEPSDVSDLDGFQDHVRYYVIDRSPAETWSSYLNTNPAEQWDGPIGRFSALYDPSTDMLYTRDSGRMPELTEDQILFIDLHIEYLAHIPAAFRISRIDPEARAFSFTYLEENASHGMQVVEFFPAESTDGMKTIVRHRSWFSSGSSLRDRLFYPPYHTQAIDEYHRRVAELEGLHLTITNPRKLKKKGLVPEGLPL